MFPVLRFHFPAAERNAMKTKTDRALIKAVKELRTILGNLDRESLSLKWVVATEEIFEENDLMTPARVRVATSGVPAKVLDTARDDDGEIAFLVAFEGADRATVVYLGENCAPI